VSGYDQPTPDSVGRALSAPFLTPVDFTPIPGTCSRCGGPAWLGERRWWHDDEPCRARYGQTAEFLPD